MATLRVDGAAVAALGEDLRELAEVLTDLDRVGMHASDLGDVSVARALDELLGNWTAVRVELVCGLTALASAAGGRELAARVRHLLSSSERKESRMKAICVCTALIVLAGLGAIRPGPSAAGRDTPEESAIESRPASVAAGEKGPSADAEEPGKREPSRHSGSRPAEVKTRPRSSSLVAPPGRSAMNSYRRCLRS